jgi:hypothetical protein
VIALTSKIEMKEQATKYANKKTKMQGVVGSTLMGAVMGGRIKYAIIVVQRATNIFARNMKEPAIDSTNENLAEFFKINRKLWRAEGQKFSDVIAQ